MYQVKKIYGKGLGCIASMDIKKGSVILSENPQINVDAKKVLNTSDESSFIEILKMWECYKQLSEADQIEYMKLHNKYESMEILPLELKTSIKKEVLIAKSKIRFASLRLELKKEEEEKIFKIFNIYVSNSFGRGLRIETSRFNHSCQPNANPCHVYDQDQINHEQIRAISDIKKGEEITISYLREYDFLLRNRQFRQDHLNMGWFFICSCDLCKNEVEDKDDMFQELIQEAYRYHHVNSINAIAAGRVDGKKHYPLEICRREISHYKQIYKIAKDKNVQLISLFKLLERAFGAATLGYQLHQVADLKNDAEVFAKAAEKFGEKVGKDLVTRGKPDYWKQKYEKLDLCLKYQPYGYGYGYVQGL